MADLQTYTFDQLVEQQATAAQASSTALVNFGVGSILRAAAQAFATVALWLQALILQLLTVTRAATSTSADLDSWMADYEFERLSAVAASGPLTFGRYTATNLASVAVGQLVQSADGTVSYAVVADTTQPTYSASAGAYLIPAGTATATVTVQATTAGSVGNAIAGAINTLSQAIAGIDYVTNATAFTNGVDAESDPNFRARFVTYLASLFKATKAAIGYAITSLQQGLSYAIVECQSYAGTAQAGYFYVVVDDGSGSASSTTLANVASAVDAVRACGIQFSAFATVPLTANIVVNLTSLTGYVHTTVCSAVSSAINTYVAGLPSDTALSMGGLMSVILGIEGVAPYPTPVITINGSTADLVPTVQQTVVPGTITVT